MNDFDPTRNEAEAHQALQLVRLDKRPLGLSQGTGAVNVISGTELNGRRHSFVTHGEEFSDPHSGEEMVFGIAVDSEDGTNTYDAAVSQEALDAWRQAQEEMRRAMALMLPDWPEPPTVQPESTANWPEPLEPSKRVPRSSLNILKPRQER